MKGILLSLKVLRTELNKLVTFSIFCIPIMDIPVEGAAQEMFSVASKLNVSDCLGVANVGVCTCSVLGDIKEMYFALRISHHQKVSDFGEEPTTLVACFLTTNPCLCILFGDVALGILGLKVCRGLQVRKSLIIVLLAFPVKVAVGFEVLLIFSGLLNFFLLSKLGLL